MSVRYIQTLEIQITIATHEPARGMYEKDKIKVNDKIVWKVCFQRMLYSQIYHIHRD